MKTIAAVTLVEQDAFGATKSIEMKLGPPLWTDDHRRPWLCQIFLSGRTKEPFAVYGDDSLQAVSCSLLFMSSYVNDAIEAGHLFWYGDSPFTLEALQTAALKTDKCSSEKPDVRVWILERQRSNSL